MKNVLSKIKFILIALMAFAFITSVALFGVNVKAEEYSITSITSFEMLSGGSIRIEEENNAKINGVRFTVTLSAKDREEMAKHVGAGEKYSSIETGVIILPKDYLGHEIPYGDGTSNPSIANLFGTDENEAIYGWATWDKDADNDQGGKGAWLPYTGREVQVININTQSWKPYTYVENGKEITAYKYTGSISGIVTGNIAREFYSCGYMRAKLNGIDAYDYIMTDGTAVSAYYIAKKAVDDWDSQITEIDELIAQEVDSAVIAELNAQKAELEGQKSSMSEKYVAPAEPQSGADYEYTINVYTQNDDGSYSLYAELKNTAKIGEAQKVGNSKSGGKNIIKYGRNSTGSTLTLPDWYSLPTADYNYEEIDKTVNSTASLQVKLGGEFSLYYKKVGVGDQVTNATDELEAGVPTIMFDKKNSEQFGFKSFIETEKNYNEYHLYKINPVTGEKTEIDYLPNGDGLVDTSSFEGIYRFVAIHKTTKTTEYVINVEFYNSNDGAVWAPFGTEEGANYIRSSSAGVTPVVNNYTTPVYDEDLDMYVFCPDAGGAYTTIFPAHSQAYYNMFDSTYKFKFSFQYIVNGVNVSNNKLGVTVNQSLPYRWATVNYVDNITGETGVGGTSNLAFRKVTENYNADTSIYVNESTHNVAKAVTEGQVFENKTFSFTTNLSSILTDWNKLFLNEGREEAGYDAWGNRPNDFMLTTYSVSNYNAYTYTAQNEHNFVMAVKWEITRNTANDFNALTNVTETMSDDTLIDLSKLSSQNKADFNLLDLISSANIDTATKMVSWADTVSLSLSSHKYSGVAESMFTYSDLDPNHLDLNDLEKAYYDYTITCVKGSTTKTIKGEFDLFDKADGVIVLPTEEKYIPNVIGKVSSQTWVPTVTVDDGMFKAEFDVAKTESNYVALVIRALHSQNYYNIFYNGSKNSDDLPNAGYVFTYDYKFSLADGIGASGDPITQATSSTTGYNYFAGYPRAGKGDGTSSGTWQTQLYRDVKLSMAFYYDVLVDNFIYLSTDAVNNIAGNGSRALLTTVGNHAGVPTIWVGNLTVTDGALASYDYSTKSVVYNNTIPVKDKGDAGLIDVKDKTVFDVKSVLTQKAGYNYASDLSYIKYYEGLYGKAHYYLIDRGGNETKLSGSVLPLTETALREYNYEVRIGDAVVLKGSFDLYASSKVPVWNYSDDNLLSYVTVVRRGNGRLTQNLSPTGNPRRPSISLDGNTVKITNIDTGNVGYFGILPVHSKAYYEAFKGKGYIFNYRYQSLLGSKNYTANYGYFGNNASGAEADMINGKTVSLSFDTMMNTYFDPAFGADFATSQNNGAWNAWGTVSMLGINCPTTNADVICLSIPKVTVGLSSFNKVTEEMSENNLIDLNELSAEEKQNFNVLSLISDAKRYDFEVLTAGVDSLSVTFTSLYGALTPVVFDSTTIDLAELDKVAYKISIKATQMTTSNKEIFVGYVDLFDSADGIVWLPVDEKYTSYVMPYESGTDWGTLPSATVTVEDGLYKVSYSYGSDTASWMHVARPFPLHTNAYYQRAYTGDTRSSSYVDKGVTVPTTLYNSGLSYSYSFKYTVADGQKKDGTPVSATTSTVINLHQFMGYPLNSDTGAPTYQTQYKYNTVHTFTVPYDLIVDNFANLTKSWTNAAADFLFYQTANAAGNTTLYFGNFDITVGSTAVVPDEVDVDASELLSYDLTDAISDKGETAIEVASKLGTPTYVYKKGNVVLDGSVIDLTDMNNLADYTVEVKVGGKNVYAVNVSIADSTLPTATRVDSRYTETAPKLIEVTDVTSFDLKTLLSADDKAVLDKFNKYTAEKQYVLTDYAGNETVIENGEIAEFTELNRRFYKLNVKLSGSDFVVYTTYVDFYLEDDGLVWLPSGEEYVSFVKGFIVAGSNVLADSAVTTYDNGHYVVTFAESTGSWSNARSAKILPLHSKAYYEMNCSAENPCELSYEFKFNLLDGATVEKGTAATFRAFGDSEYHFGFPLNYMVFLGYNDRYNGRQPGITLYTFVSNWDTYMNAKPNSGEGANQGMLIRSATNGQGIMVMDFRDFHFIQQAPLTTEYYFETAKGSNTFAIDSTKTTNENVNLGKVVADVKTFAGYNYDIGNANEVIDGKIGFNGLTLKVYYKVADTEAELVDVKGKTGYSPLADVSDTITAWENAGRHLDISITGVDGHVVSGTTILAESANYMVYTLTVTYNSKVLIAKTFDLYDSSLAPTWDTVTDGDLSRVQTVNWGNSSTLKTEDYVTVETVDEKNYYVFRTPATGVTATYKYQLFGLTPLHSKAYYETYRNLGYFFTYEYKVITENGQKHSQLFFCSQTNKIWESGFELDTIFTNSYSLEDLLDTYWGKFTDSLATYKAAGSPWGAKEHGMFALTGSDTYYIDTYIGEFKFMKFSEVTTEYYKETSAGSGEYAIDNSLTDVAFYPEGGVSATIKPISGYTYDFGNANEVIFTTADGLAKTLKVYYNVSVEDEIELITVSSNASYDLLADYRDLMGVWTTNGKELTVSLVGIDGTEFNTAVLNTANAENIKIYTLTIKDGNTVLYSNKFDLYNPSLAPTWGDPTASKWNASVFQFNNATPKSLDTVEFVTDEGVGYYRVSVAPNAYYTFNINPLHTKAFYENYRGMGYEFSYTLKEVEAVGQFYMNSATNIMNNRNSSGIYTQTFTLENLLDNQWDWIFNGVPLYQAEGWNARGKVGMFCSIGSNLEVDPPTGVYEIGNVRLVGESNVNVNVYTETEIGSEVFVKNNDLSYVLQKQQLLSTVNYEVPYYVFGYKYVSHADEVLSVLVDGTSSIEVYFNKVETGDITVETYLEQNTPITGSFLKDNSRTRTVTLNKGVRVYGRINDIEKETVLTDKSDNSYIAYYLEVPTISGYYYHFVDNKTYDFINENWYDRAIKLYYLIADRDIGLIDNVSTSSLDVTAYVPTKAFAVSHTSGRSLVDVTFNYELSRVRSDDTFEPVNCEGLIDEDVLDLTALEGKYLLTITDSADRIWTLSFEVYNSNAPYWNVMNEHDVAVARTNRVNGPSYNKPLTTGYTTSIVDASEATEDVDALLNGKTGKFVKVVFDDTVTSANLVFNLFPVHDLSVYNNYVGKGYVVSYEVFTTAAIGNTSFVGYKDYAMRWSYEVINTWRAGGVSANASSAVTYSIPFDSYIVSEENKVFNAYSTAMNLNRFNASDDSLAKAMGRFEIETITEGDTVYIGNVRVEKMIDHVYCSTTAVEFDVRNKTSIDLREFLTDAQKAKYDYIAATYAKTQNITWTITPTTGDAITVTANANTAPMLDLVANKTALSSGPAGIHATLSGNNGIKNEWREMRFINTANTNGLVKCVTFTNLPTEVSAMVVSAESTVKVLQDTVYDAQDDIFSSDPTINAFKNERESTQLIIRPTTSVGSYNVTISDLTDGVNVFSASNIKIYHEMYANLVIIKSPYVSTPKGDYPDALLPLDVARNYNVASIDANTNQGVWLEINVPSSQPAGTYTGTITISLGTSEIEKTLTVVVYDYTLSDVQHLATKFGFGYDSISRLDGEKVISYDENGKESVSYVLSEEVTDAYLQFLLDYGVSTTTTGSPDTLNTYFIGWMGRPYNPDYLFDTTMVTIDGKTVHQYEYPLINADGTHYGTAAQHDYSYGTARIDTYIDEMIKAVNMGATKIQIPLTSAMAVGPTSSYTTAYGSVNEIRSDITNSTDRASVINQLMLRTFMERMYQKGIENNVDIFAKGYLYPVWVDEYSCSASKTLNAQRMLTYLNGFFDKMADYLAYKYNGDATYNSNSAFAQQLIASVRKICVIITGENLDPFEPELLQSICGTAEPVILTNVCFCPIIDKYNSETLRNQWADWAETSGTKQWVYTAISPLAPYPTHHIEDALLSTRAISWMMYNYDIEGYLYWSVINAQYQDSCYLLDANNNRVQGLTNASGNYMVKVDNQIVELYKNASGVYAYSIGGKEHLANEEIEFVVCYQEGGNWYYNAVNGTKTAASSHKDILLDTTYMDIDEYYSNAIHYQNTAGEGYFLYPGSKFGITGPIGSLRLQAFADGVEEYNMLYALEEMYNARISALGVKSDVNFNNVMERLTEQMYTGTRMNYNDTYLASFGNSRKALMNMIVLADKYGIIVDNYTINHTTGVVTFTVSAPTSLGDISSAFTIGEKTSASAGDYTIYTITLDGTDNVFTLIYDGMAVNLSVLKLREVYALESVNWAPVTADSTKYKTYVGNNLVNSGAIVEMVDLDENEFNGNVAGSYYKVSPGNNYKNAMLGFTLLPSHEKSYYEDIKDYANLVFDVYISVEDKNGENIIDYRLYYTFGFPNNTQVLSDRCWFTLSIPLAWIYDNWDSIVNTNNEKATGWTLSDKALFTLYGLGHNDGSEIGRFYIGNFRIEHE